MSSYYSNIKPEIIHNHVVTENNYSYFMQFEGALKLFLEGNIILNTPCTLKLV